MIHIYKKRGGRKAIRPLLFLLVFVISAISSVAVQELISLQGKVTTSAGALVNDGNLTVLVYDAPTGGNMVYNSSEDFNTSIQAGSFDVLLGSVTDMHLKLSDIYYMDMEVNGEDVDWDGEERKQFQSGVGREVSGNFSVDISDSTFFVDEINNRVGIGTILPGDAILNVSGTVDAWQLTINGSAVGAVSGWTDDGAIVRLSTSTDSVGIGTSSPGATLEIVNGSAVNALFNVTDGSDTRFLINGAGNVGIGTTGPGAPLEIYKAAGADVTGSGLIVSRYFSGGNYRGGAIYSRYITGASADALVFGVTGVDAKNPYSDFDQARMVITHLGNVGIGTASPTKNLDVWGTVNMSQLTAASGSPSTLCRNLGEVTVNPAQTCTVSSKVFKDNIVQLKNGEENRLMQLNVSSFEFKTETGKTHYGLIAEDVVKIYPELGRYNENGTLVTYEITELIPLLLRGYQDQQIQIEDLKSELCRKDGSYSWCASKITAVQPVNETPAEQIPEVPVSPVEEAPVQNSAPVIESFMPETVPVMSVGDSQEFTINVSDADNDVLSLQWFVNNLPVVNETSSVFTFAAVEFGSFEVKVLVTDGKDYSTHKWSVNVNEAGRSFGITGAAVGVVSKGSSLFGWLRSLF
ncbi:MAG: tail fiber domain-containing protein [Nanoarchaeota archaeon]|nr:tail fiber domain-containing protein [Nanoarchaeota archaeon]